MSSRHRMRQSGVGKGSAWVMCVMGWMVDGWIFTSLSPASQSPHNASGQPLQALRARRTRPCPRCSSPGASADASPSPGVGVGPGSGADADDAATKNPAKAMMLAPALLLLLLVPP